MTSIDLGRESYQCNNRDPGIVHGVHRLEGCTGRPRLWKGSVQLEDMADYG